MIGTLIFATLAMILLGLAWASWILKDRPACKPENNRSSTTLTFIPPRNETGKHMTKETLRWALALSDRIDELKTFRRLLDRVNGRDKNNRGFLRIVRENRVALGASFYFGMGRDTRTVDIPSTLYKRIQQLAAEHQAELERELAAL